MCDTMEVSYDDGDIVWVKLGSCWWPGEVWALDKLPNDMTKSFRKTPIAVVKFFEEDSFEYVKNTNLIYKYNCSRKNEFIKKGMDLHRGKHSHMEKFPSDIVQAERLTKGDEDILECLEFSAVEVRKPSYAGIFGSPAKTQSYNTPMKKGRLTGSAKRKSDLNQPKITHPRIIQKFLKGTSDYKAHILVQEPKRNSTPVTPDSSKFTRSESNASPSVSESSPKTPSGNCAPSPGMYACHACSFTATRLNVMILHNKSHSAGFIPYTPPKKHKIKTSPLKLKTVKLESPPGISSSGNIEKKSRKKQKKTQSLAEPAAEISLPSSKRKGAKVKDRDLKKPKTDIEIKNSLLADWSEDSDESMDILSSLKLTENQTAPDTQKLEESEELLPESVETEIQNAKEPEAGSIKMPDEIDVRKHASCFDFDDDDDTELPIESLGRKIPRVSTKSDDIPKRSADADRNDDTYNKLEGKESKTTDEETEQADGGDINIEIDNLLQETAVPELPSLPSDLKLGENFQKGKAIKFPDKESTERLPIFKTKTFFRSRHSRSQDAIEKYVTDNVGADKRPTYMEETHAGPVPADIFALCESDNENVPVEVPCVVAEQPAIPDVKTVKLTPKIMLKKMKILVMPKKEPTLLPSEIVSLKHDVEDAKTVIENASCHVQDDKWTNENLEKLLETDSFGDEKKTESYTATDDLLGTIEEVQSEIFQNSEIAANHVNIQKDAKILLVDDDKAEISAVIAVKETAISIDDAVDMQTKVDNVPTESDLQIAEALINLPARAGPPPLFIAIDQSPPGKPLEPATQENPAEFTESDPSFNAAESLVQMSETFASEPVQSHETLNTIPEDVAEPPITLPSNTLVSSPAKMVISSETSGTDLLSVVSDRIENNFLSDSSKIPTIETDKVESLSKVVLPKMTSPKGREKILNFNVSGGIPPKAQKQKVIIRRTAVPKIHRSGSDRFGDTSHEKLVLSNKTVGGRDGDVQTFTIERPVPDDQESSLSTRIDKAKKFFPGKQKLIIKPRGAIITSTGKILQTVEPKELKKDEEILFDINSMPIVLSEEILSTDTMRTPVASQEAPTVSKAPDAIPEIKKFELETITKIVSPIKKYNAEPLVNKPSNFILKPVIEKSASPNILSKSKIKSYKNLILMDKQPVTDQKFSKKEDVKESTQGKIIKTSSPSTLKTEKYIIVPSTGSKMAPGERTQKIILNPQTGKGQVLLGRVNDAAQTENFPAGKSQKTIAKIIQNRSPQSTGNAIMILTNAQGVQSKIVLSSEHQRLLFPKKSIQTTAITPQSVVTSKGTILSPIAVHRNKNVNVTSHSIIAPQSQIIHPGVGSGFMSSGRQIPPSRLVSKKNLPTPPKTQLIMTGNPNTRTILTGRPGQTILTSKGQLITQSSIVTSQSKISNIVKTTTVLSQPGRQLKLVKTALPAKPQIKTKQGSLSQTADMTSSLSGAGESTTLLLKSSPGKGQTFIRGPGERPLVIPQRGGVLQLTVAQFEHMQKTGRLVHKAVAQKSAVQSRSIIDTSPKSQNPKFIIQKYSNSKRTAEQAGIKPKGITPYSANVPPLALIQSESPVKRQKLRELLSTKPDINDSSMHGLLLSRSSEPKAPIDQIKSRASTVAQQIAPAPLNRTTEMDTFQKTERILPPLENLPSVEIELPPSAEALKATVDTANPDRLAPPAESQLLAVPGENFGGPPDSFFLCVEENGTLTPVNNQPLVLENNQLVPMVTEPPPPLRIEEAVAPIPSNSVAMEESSDGQTPGIILNTGDQQILLDRQTLLGLLSGEGQQLVTADGQRLILQGDVQQLISALAGNPEIASLLSGGQQILLDGGDAAHPLVVPADQSNLPSSIANDYLFSRGVQASANQDILAAALAGTDVFQQDPLIHDSLNIVTEGADGLTEIDSLSPEFQNFNASVSVHSQVSETSSTLNQPIMSPLEVPTKKRSGRQTDGGKGGILMPPKNLKDSLAGIGVTTPSIPTSLDLPITVTDPRIAPKVSVNPLSLSCGVIYQSSGMLSTSMLSPGVRMSDVDSSQGRLDYKYDGYGLSADPVEKFSASLIRKGDYVSKKPTPKLVSDPILSSQREKVQKGETISAAPSMPVLSSSMPRLDDSSSDGFPDDQPQLPPETVQAKTYSPISMPLLTEDASEELSAGESAVPIETSAACNVSQEPSTESFVPHIQETFIFSEAKSEPVLIESETTVEMKPADIETDVLELQKHLPQNETVKSNSMLPQADEEINMTVEDRPVVCSETADLQVSETVPFHSDKDIVKEHDTPENSLAGLPSFHETQHNADVLDNPGTPEVEVNSFPDDETVSEMNNASENFMEDNDVTLRHSNTADVTLPEDLTVSDACDSHTIDNHREVDCLLASHVTPCEQTSVICEHPKTVEQPESNTIESSIIEGVSVNPQSDAETLQHNEETQSSSVETEKTFTPLHENNFEFENDISETHSNINEHQSDKTELQCHPSEPEISVDYSYITEPGDILIEPENIVKPASGEQSNDVLKQEDNLSEFRSKNMETNNITELEVDNIICTAENISECDRLESIETFSNRVSPVNDISESLQAEECEKPNEYIEMTDDSAFRSETPVTISDNGEGIHSYREPPPGDHSLALNNEEHTNDDLKSDVIEPSSVPSETCESPDRPITPYRLGNTTNDEIRSANVPDDLSESIHVPRELDQNPEQVPPTGDPNLNSAPSTPELMQNYSDSSSDDSMEIPIQPSISVSHHLVQTMCTADRPNDNTEKKSPEDSVQPSDNSFTFDDER